MEYLGQPETPSIIRCGVCERALPSVRAAAYVMFYVYTTPSYTSSFYSMLLSTCVFCLVCRQVNCITCTRRMCSTCDANVHSGCAFEGPATGTDAADTDDPFDMAFFRPAVVSICGEASAATFAAHVRRKVSV